MCSTDDYHVLEGVYVFQPVKLSEFHGLNLKRAREAMDEGKSVVVDNTNIEAWAPREYVRHALRKGIHVVFIRVTGEFQNVHDVPQWRVDIMRRNMEELTLASVLDSVAPWERKEGTK